MTQSIITTKITTKKKEADKKVLDNSNDPYFTEPNLSHIQKSIKELKEGKGTIHEIIEINDN